MMRLYCQVSRRQKDQSHGRRFPETISRSVLRCLRFTLRITGLRSEIERNLRYKEVALAHSKGIPGSRRKRIWNPEVSTSVDFQEPSLLKEEILAKIHEEVSRAFEENHNDANTAARKKFKVALKDTRSLLETSDQTIIEGELYRFISDPLIHCPAILALATSHQFRRALRPYPALRLAGVNLRRSQPTQLEQHTCGFHRDYNSFRTYKLFIGLSPSSEESFLEYYPKTALNTTSMPHYSPDHIRKADLPRHIYKQVTKKTGGWKDSLTMINTSAIHRELPKETEVYTLILTFLTCPDFGTGRLNVMSKTLEAAIVDSWSREYLAFLDPTDRDKGGSKK